MRLPERILHTACLLGFKKETPQYAGSGCVVAVPRAHGNSQLYLVTAKHVAEDLECCPIVMGFSYKDGSKAILEADSLHWYTHPTEADAVDVAVTPFETENLRVYGQPADGSADVALTPQWDLLDGEPIPQHQFASQEILRNSSIAVGDEISASGVFTRFSWEDRHLPIVRTGHLAMLPTVPIPVRNFEPMEAYVAEIGGLNGSPVWARAASSFNPAQKERIEAKPSPPFNGDTELIFLGLLHGPWEVPKHAIEGLSTRYTEDMSAGMSIVVPAHKILEVIHQPELAALRKKNDDK